MCFWVRVGWERSLSFQNEPKVDNGGRPLMHGHVYAKLCAITMYMTGLPRPSPASHFLHMLDDCGQV